jgi:DNA-binding CsgD family transcriptional regulator
LRAIEDPVSIVDRDFRVLWTNAASGPGGEPVEQIYVGKRCHVVLTGRRRPCTRCPVRPVFEEGRSVVVEEVVPSVDGVPRLREVHAYPVRDGTGRIVAAVKIGFLVASSCPEPAVPLSPRELEVLRLVTTGCSNAAIAAELGISSHTVKSHVGHVFDKLGVNDRVSAAAWAVRRGLV